jgi:hypothetical protein
MGEVWGVIVAGSSGYALPYHRKWEGAPRLPKRIMKMTQIPPATIHPATSHHPPFFRMKDIREYRICITDWKGSMVIPRMVNYGRRFPSFAGWFISRDACPSQISARFIPLEWKISI